MATFTSKREIVEKLQKQIEVNDRTAIHTLMFIYGRQVIDEQIHNTVKYHNGMGFKPQDARFGSSLAKWYEDHGRLSEKQIASVKRIVKKYAGQVVEAKISEGKIQKLGREWIWK